MNCKKFDFNLYFEMENLVAQLIEQQVFSPKEIYTKFKDVLKNDYNLKNITNDDLKSYFVSSSFESDVITSLMSYSDVENTETLEKGLDFTESDKMFNHVPDNVNTEIEQKEESSDNIVISNIIEKPIKRIKKLESVNDLYNNYFSGSMLHYNRFRKDFARNIFSASLISFDVKNSYIVKSDEDVNNNIQSYRNKLETIISEFLLSQNIEPEEKTKDKLSQIEGLKISNLDAFGSSDNTLNEVYNAFIALTHFDDLIKLYSTIISKDPKSNNYRLNVEHKMKNNFSDNPIDIIAEISQLTKSLIEFTPILDNNGKEIKGKYLKINHLTSIISKFKNSNILDNLTMSLRENVEENISIMMKKYLENPHDFKNSGFDNSDTEIIRSIYNYFYKTGEESPSILKQMDASTVSMLTIKNNEYSNKNYSDYNLLADTITTTIDKTIGQKYITLKDTQEGMIRQITKDITINKYVSQLKNDLNAKSNVAMSLPESVDNALMINDVNNISLYKTDKVINFAIPGLPIDVRINPFNKFTKGFLKCPINNLLNQDDISNFINNGIYPTDEGKKNYISLLEVIGKYTGINFFQNNGELLNNISAKGIRFLEEGLYTASRVLFFKSLTDDYNAAKVNAPDLKISHFLSGKNINLSDKEIYGNRLTPFNEISTVEFFKEVGYALATIKGDVAASISRNLNGDGLPNNSLLNLIGDYKTIFNQHKSAKPEDSITSNFFVYNDNHDIIKDVIFRSDVQMKDGAIKNVKSFNASEIMYQGVFSDFWSNAYDPKGSNGVVMMEPTVFADKSGQPMKVIDMGANIKYNYTNEITGKVEFDVNDKSLFDLSNMPSSIGLTSKLADLYFYTMKGQYSKLHVKLMNDYKFLVNNMLLDTTTMLTIGKDDNNKPISQSVSDYVSSVIKNTNNITLDNINNILNKGIKLENYRKSSNGESIDIQLEFHHSGKSINGYLLKKFKEYQIVEYDKSYHQRRMRQEDKKFAVTYSKILGDTVVLKDNGEYKPDFENVVKSYLVNSQKVTDDKLEDALSKFKETWVKLDGTLKIMTDINGEDIDITEELIYKNNIKVTLNPLLRIMQESNRVLMGNYNHAMVGSPHGHPVKIGKSVVLNMFDPKLNKAEYKRNPKKYIYDDILKTTGNKENALQELWEEVEESARTIAMHKRMVSYQAKLHPFTQGLITGVTKNMKMMVMSDVKHKIWNTVGVEGNFDVADGSGWVSMTASMLFRNSMGDAGTDTVSLKGIRHAIDGNTAIAHLDKYAIQALSNEVLRQSATSKRPWTNLNKIMLDSIKFDEVFPDKVGNIFDVKYQLKPESASVIATAPTVLNNEELIDFMKDVNTLPSFLKGRNIKYSIEGTGVISTLLGIAYDPLSNTYLIRKSFTGPDSSDIGFTTENGYTMDSESSGFKRVSINSLYDIWTEVLGGMYSINESSESSQISFNGKTYSYGDDSNEALAQFMNNIVVKKDDNVITSLKTKGIETSEFNPELKTFSQTNYYQPLKEALIWQINNTSGMKNGAKNINNNNILQGNTDNPDYFTTNSMHYGIQGNFDHKFSEESEARVTEATQVISAAVTGGYMTNDVTRLYKALATVITHSVSEEQSALLKQDGEVAELFAKKMIKIMSTKDRLGLAQAWGKVVDDSWSELKKKRPDFPYSETKFKIAFSDPNFYGALVSSISGVFNSSVIRRDLPGLACVLSQCHDAITVVDNDTGTIEMANIAAKNIVRELTNTYKNQIKEAKSYEERNTLIAELNNEINNYTIALNSGKYGKYAKTVNITPEEIDSYSKLRLTNGTDSIDFEITSAEQYYQIKDGNYSSVIGFDQLKGDKVLQKLTGIPRNLVSSRFSFSFGDIVLNEMDLDASRALWSLNKYIKGEHVPKYISSLIENIAKKYNIPLTIGKDENGNLLMDISAIKHELTLEQQRQHALLTNNIFTYKGAEIQGLGRVLPGEVILPNYNMHKFGISIGTSLGDIDYAYFADKFKKFNEITRTDASFYLQDKNGDHVYLLTEDQWINEKNIDTAEDSSFKVKNIDGVNYYIDSNNNNVFEYKDGMELKRINGNLCLKYDGSPETVNSLYSSDYYSGIGYNFSESTKENIFEYIKAYDINNIKYTTMSDLSARQLNKAYKADETVRFDNFINEMLASWDKQLEMIGVRIPAQSLQSVMAMKIVGFTEQNVNRAYVPVKKNWLDGSKR